ncbi:MAG TPA: hypothetical protein VLL57_10455 [Candidatus Binataceae bacterium]|jgi:hypothetical protein|nr:hypothetical protein [Candidatus Binataceae bacterium]
MAAHSVNEYRSVEAWRHDLSEQWGGDPLAEEPDKLMALQRFCEFIGEDPDQIVARCFRIRKADGERVISAKWRTHYAGKVKEFRDRNADSQRLAADVLSFLIHNGVMMQI